MRRFTFGGTLAGLRHRQKVDRERRILQAAITLFRRDGYRAVRIEDLAELAGVSVGTVYNYHATKGDILIAIVALEVEEVLEAGAHTVANPPVGVETALLTLIFQYYDHSLEYLTKEMWRSAMALAIETPHTPNGRRYADLDRQLAAQVGSLIETLQRRGEVHPSLDAHVLGDLVFNTLNMMFIDFVKDDMASLAVLKGAVAVRTGLLARLIAVGQGEPA